MTTPSATGGDGNQPPAAAVFIASVFAGVFVPEDYTAWSTSIEHIRGTPGWEGSSWPRPMSPQDNRRDLERHARDFESRKGFTYTVIDQATGVVVGCVYIYPARDEVSDAQVTSWVRATSSNLDADLWRAVSEWLADSWPFERFEYAPRR
jgi:RimJ/RimL family protein N-acetyltransferase